VTVASLNLHCGYTSRGEPYDVVAAICGLGADIICLQEVWLPYAAAARSTSGGGSSSSSAQVEEAAGKLGASVHSAVMMAWSGLATIGLPSDGPGHLRLAVLSTVPVLSAREIRLGRAPGDAVPRIAQVLRYRLPDGAGFTVVNTHLTHRFSSPVQLRRLSRILSSGPGSSSPRVIAGDLNMPRLLAARARGLRCAVASPTWPARRPLVQLDHILAGPGVTPVRGAALAETGSDHRPVRAELAVAPA
jgi:endonuclease/exonuclease/phosphatase family metal-dependent hydrolase